MKICKIVASMLFALTATASFADPAVDTTTVSMSASELKSVMIKNELQRREIAWKLAPIKNKEQLQISLQKNSPLDALSSEAKQRFIDGLVFTDKGLGGIYYGDLVAELTPTQIHKILSLFGAQHLISKFTEARVESDTDAKLLKSPSVNYGVLDDHKEYRCIARADCYESSNHICMSSCYH
ncbi:hypothetical protein [Zooshikella ganghwensis]|uniref:Uncharacterized protein n=1 Tax=Zooshikella ganghwensis TaxID=202772 RepID=A0A4P9VH11_9GAMM|nr:hypothetical protein [Zooshikella ganghwensis]RDH41500.1 hypothetical protein B9G39_28195 [Zooshikella ganghwensis]